MTICKHRDSDGEPGHSHDIFMEDARGNGNSYDRIDIDAGVINKINT